MIKSEVVKKRMEELGINQTQLAEQMNVSRMTISTWLTGTNPTPSMHNLTLLGKTLGFQSYDEYMSMDTDGNQVVKRGTEREPVAA